MRASGVIATGATALLLAACGSGGDDGGPDPVAVPPAAAPAPPPPPPPPQTPTAAVSTRAVATFENPWAMVFLPDGRLLVTERLGRLRLASTSGEVSAPIAGVPTVASAGQGGLLDVALDPRFASNGLVYLSYSEPVDGNRRLAVARGRLVTAADGANRLDGVTVIWRAQLTTTGEHFGARMAFSPDGKLFITSGERHQGAPAQDPGSTLGKIVRINPDGSVPTDNPFSGQAGAPSEVWTLGHRNPYGLVFAPDGRLFESEMGPEGGDEFNLIERGRNYGWPDVSEGNQYGGAPIPRHATAPGIAAPLFSWTPVIAPGGMIQYRGSRFVGWDGDFILAGLVSQGLVRVRVGGSTATEVARVSLGARIREVEQGPDGTIWVLEDGGAGRLLQLTPA